MNSWTLSNAQANRRSSAARKKGLIKRVWARQVIARRFRWNFEGSRNLIRAHCGISRGEEFEKSRNRRRTDPTKKSGYKNLGSSFEWVGHDRRHSSCENLLKIILRFTCARYVHYLVNIFSAIRDTPALWNLFLCVKDISRVFFSVFKNTIFLYVT